MGKLYPVSHTLTKFWMTLPWSEKSVYEVKFQWAKLINILTVLSYTCGNIGKEGKDQRRIQNNENRYLASVIIALCSKIILVSHNDSSFWNFGERFWDFFPLLID